jgi:hypothetical protein
VHRTATAITAILIAVAGITIPAPALAAPSPGPAATVQADPPDSCTAASVCGYVNTGYDTDQGYEFIPARHAGVCEIVSLRNAWSGVYNNSGRTIRMFRNTGCTGTSYKQIANGGGHWQFSIKYGPTWDNTVDAIQFR